MGSPSGNPEGDSQPAELTVPALPTQFDLPDDICLKSDRTAIEDTLGVAVESITLRP